MPEVARVAMSVVCLVLYYVSDKEQQLLASAREMGEISSTFRGHQLSSGLRVPPPAVDVSNVGPFFTRDINS